MQKPQKPSRNYLGLLSKIQEPFAKPKPKNAGFKGRSMNTFRQLYGDMSEINASLGRVSDNSVIPMVLLISLRFIVTQADTVT